jgi:hypothetical protein
LEDCVNQPRSGGISVAPGVSPGITYKWSYTYDERGNIKETIKYAPGGSVSSRDTFTYEYDDRGNWIKRITSRELSKDGRHQIESEVTHRIVTYF